MHASCLAQIIVRTSRRGYNYVRMNFSSGRVKEAIIKAIRVDFLYYRNRFVHKDYPWNGILYSILEIIRCHLVVRAPTSTDITK